MKTFDFTHEDWFKLISNCRHGDLNDREWCKENGISLSTFYRKIKLLKEMGFLIPDSKRGKRSLVHNTAVESSETNTKPESNANEVFEIPTEILSSDVALPFDELPLRKDEALSPGAVITLGQYQINLFNHASPQLIGSLLYALQSSC